MRRALFLLGLALGVSIGLLIAPSPGSETRQRFRERAEPMAKRIREQAEHQLKKRQEAAAEQVGGQIEGQIQEDEGSAPLA